MTSKLEVCVLFSGRGSNLQALIDQQAQYAYQITAAISDNAEADGIARATKAQILTTVVERSHYQEPIRFEEALLSAIPASCDLILLAGFMRILTPYFLADIKRPVLNIHPSRLPAFKGLHTHQRVLQAQCFEHGCTVHRVTAELDSGPVLAQSRLCVNYQETPEQLSLRVLAQEHQLYPRVVGLIAARRLILDKGGATLDGQRLDARGCQFNHDSELFQCTPC